MQQQQVGSIQLLLLQVQQAQDLMPYDALVNALTAGGANIPIHT
jgi:hypothetical protein